MSHVFVVSVIQTRVRGHAYATVDSFQRNHDAHRKCYNVFAEPGQMVVLIPL